MRSRRPLSLSGFLPSASGRWALFGLACGPFAVGLTQGVGPTAEDDYPNGKASDSIAALQAKLDSGMLKLGYEPRQGLLRAILRELKISPSSQILVFSKTSLQTPFISASNPRAIYFNDRTYVGWIPGAPNIEIASLDPRRGPIFYTVRNVPQTRPVFARETLDCLGCHDSPMTGGVPGLAARSVFAGADGMPRLASGSYLTTYRSPFDERWGGWYVTGTHGAQRHMGNEAATGGEESASIDKDRGANVTDLSRYFDVARFLSPSSDIVALMVAEHQMEVQNLITKAGFLTRNALRDEAIYGLKEPVPTNHLESTNHRIEHACEPLVEALLCVGEFKLTAPVKGTTVFAMDYSNSAPKDRQGRSLSQLDLRKRLLRYPCSPLIYSPAFDGLPSEAKAQVYRRLSEILSGRDPSDRFRDLSADDRKAILEILRETKPEFPGSTATQMSVQRLQSFVGSTEPGARG